MRFRTGVLTAKILGIILISILICTLFIGWLIYNAGKVDLENNLKRSLKSLAATSSLMVDGDMHKRIGSVESQEYIAIQSVLQKIKKVNKLDAPIYTLRRSFEKNVVECTITTDPVYLLGARYKLKKEMIPVFNKGVVTTTGFYTDKTGTWISAYAPIRDGGGRTPLWYAQNQGYTEIVELLRKHGAK